MSREYMIDFSLLDMVSHLPIHHFPFREVDVCDKYNKVSPVRLSITKGSNPDAPRLQCRQLGMALEFDWANVSYTPAEFRMA